MLVYADRRTDSTLRSWVDEGCRALALARLQPGLDRLRDVLILAGQIEQAVYDQCGETSDFNGQSSEKPSDSSARLGTASELQALASRLTDEAAEGFYLVWSGAGAEHRIEDCLAKMGGMLQALRALGEERVCVRQPEGFAFYSLFPEQYCVSAQKWLTQRAMARSRDVLVVGIRSIGTTLSAVVRAALRASGWNADRLTIRPTGSPFGRVNQARPLYENRGVPVLIVDEGPGLSGSSMAAAAEWLSKASISDIAFLPGHENGPGEAASETIRQWWSKTPTYCTGFSEIRWGGASLQHRLASESVQWCGAVKAVQDLSAGAWRSRAFENRGDWPAVCKGFERSKILCMGENTGVLWKFCGLGGNGSFSIKAGQQQQERLGRLQEFAPEAVSQRLGFVATQWIEGRRLRTLHAKEPGVLEHIARYIAAAAGPPLDETEAEAAIGRLTTMLLCNVKEALGQAWEDRAARLVIDAPGSDTELSYGDGRLAPHEWVRTQGGKIFKTDSTGHIQDHTLVGKQSVLWDVAGAIVEWDLNQAQAELLARVLLERGVKVNSPALEFYKTAYLAFRIGFVSIGIAQAGDDVEERGRLSSALERYKGKLQAWNGMG